MTHMIVAGSFKSQKDLEKVFADLEKIGVRSDQVSIVTTQEARSNLRVVDNDNSDDGADAGANAGGIAGMLFGAVLAPAAVLIPGLNVFVAGPLFGALAGLAVGAGTGGIVGALIGAGLSEDDAAIYESEIRRGGLFLTVNAIDEAQRTQVERIFRSNNAQDMAA